MTILGVGVEDKEQALLRALKLCKWGMEDWYNDGSLVIPNALIKSPINACENMQEMGTVMEPKQIISVPDLMRIEVVLLREKILSSAQPDAIYSIQSRGAVYTVTGHFKRCITLWMYALDMQ